MAAGRAIEPIFAGLALGLGKPLGPFALGAKPHHFAAFTVRSEQQPAAWTILGIPFADLRSADLIRAKEHGSTPFAPMLAFLQFLADRAFFHDTIDSRPGIAALADSPSRQQIPSRKKPGPAARLGCCLATGGLNNVQEGAPGSCTSFAELARFFRKRNATGPPHVVRILNRFLGNASMPIGHRTDPLIWPIATRSPCRID